MKRLSLPSGLIAAVLAVSSCAEIAMVPVAAVALPLTAAFMIGFAGVATLSQVQEGFDTQQRKREENPRKDGPFIEYWPNGRALITTGIIFLERLLNSSGLIISFEKSL